MGKTSDKNMKDLSKKLHNKIDKLDSGKLTVEELEELVDDARELYERLIVIKYKAYEKYGEPTGEEETVTEPVEDTVVEEPIEETPEVKNTVEEKEEAFDFSAMSEEKPTATEIEQPSFDFSAVTEEEEEEEIEEEGILIKSEDIKSVAPKEQEEKEEDVFPKSSETKTSSSDIFKESHVEKHEPEDGDSLNEQLKTEEEELSLRKKLQNTPIADLKSEISIAKKFEYITFMFDGKNEIYEEAINHLNNCSDGEEARGKLNDYSTKFKWDLENKSSIKFVELVERRYL
jgi:hypothetical protein